MKPISFLRRFVLFTLAGLVLVFAPLAPAQQPQLEAKPTDAFFAKFEPVKAPAPAGLLLKKGDRLAICGDSITEQKMYSRIMETYLTVCVPQLKIMTRQYGWSGETAEGFLRRMTNDCLRFDPTIATTCYGMNDHRYKPYDEATAQWYRENQEGIVHAFQAAGTRVILGSPGCVGKMPSWVRSASGTVEDLNLSLCAFRNLDIDLAVRDHVAFADVFWPMFTAGFTARQKFSPNYAIAGRDGVHPDWAGHLIMAYAFLRAMGLDGDLGTFTVDLAANQATATGEHKIDGWANGELTVTSRQYPFCATGDSDKDNSLRSGMALVPFNQELNRLTLVVKGATAASYKITWGGDSKPFTADQLVHGVNLAAEFAVNPFAEAFGKVDAAVAAKQNYETRQIKTLFHGEEGQIDMPDTAALTEKVRRHFAEAIPAAFGPVKHAIRIEAQ